jgi:hypothetical protein
MSKDYEYIAKSIYVSTLNTLNNKLIDIKGNYQETRRTT